MARGPENRFIASIHRIIPLELLYHMKNHNQYVAGVADVWYSGNYGDMWVEYKYTEKLPECIDLMDTKKSYALSALQAQWLAARWQEGRRVIVVLGSKNNALLFDDRTWEDDHELDDSCGYMTWKSRRNRAKLLTRREVAKFIYKHTKGTNDIPATVRKGVERCV